MGADSETKIGSRYLVSMVADSEIGVDFSNA